MEVEILNPHGYCFGVRSAIVMAKKIKEENKDRNIYILGMLVHNEHVIKELSNLGIITIDVSPLEYEKEINKLHQGDILIFTAHGHDERLDTIAKNKGLIIYDAVCPIVKNNIKIIKNELKAQHQVIYIGIKNHPESYAVESIGKNVILFDNNLLNNYQLITDTSPFVANQTTLNYIDLNEIHKDILSHFPKSRIANEICNATRFRQDCIKNLADDIDMLLIVGSNKSSNTKRLLEIANYTHPNIASYIIKDENDLINIPYQNKRHIAITSGTSTPDEIIQRVYDYLNK